MDHLSCIQKGQFVFSSRCTSRSMDLGAVKSADCRSITPSNLPFTASERVCFLSLQFRSRWSLNDVQPGRSTVLHWHTFS